MSDGGEGMSQQEKYEEFVAHWMAAYRAHNNQSCLAEQLDMSRQAVAQKAAQLRKLGVDLPTLTTAPRGSLEKLDIGRLNEIVKS